MEVPLTIILQCPLRVFRFLPRNCLASMKARQATYSVWTIF